MAAFLVLWGHVVQYSAVDSFDFFDNVVYKTIYSFHMPLFMLVSGYTYSLSFDKRDLKSVLINRTQGMLQPIVIGGVAFYYLGVILLRAFNGNYEGIGSGAWLPTLDGMWFLWSILGASIVVAVVFKIASNMVLRILGILLGFGFVYLLPNYSNNIFVYPYFIIGFLYGRHKERVNIKVKIEIAIISAILFVVSLRYFKKEHLIYISGIKDMSINLFRWTVGLLGSITAMGICCILCRAKKNQNKVIDALSVLGRKSLQIYVTQRLILEVYYAKGYEAIMTIAGRNILAENMDLFNFLFSPCIAIIMAIVLIGVICGLEKMKASKIIFRR